MPNRLNLDPAKLHQMCPLRALLTFGLRYIERLTVKGRKSNPRQLRLGCDEDGGLGYACTDKALILRFQARFWRIRYTCNSTLSFRGPTGSVADAMQVLPVL